MYIVTLAAGWFPMAAGRRRRQAEAGGGRGRTPGPPRVSHPGQAIRQPASGLAGQASILTRQVVGRVQRRQAQDHVRSFLRDHQRGRIGVDRGQRRHDRGIDHAQALQAMNTQLVINHRIPTVGRPHAAGAHHVVDRGPGLAGKVQQFLVGLIFVAWHFFLGHEGG